MRVWTVRSMGKKPVQQGEPEQFVTALFFLPFLLSWELGLDRGLTDTSLLLTDGSAACWSLSQATKEARVLLMGKI